MSNQKNEVNRNQMMGTRRGSKRFGPVEKPKNKANALKRLLKYIASSKLLLITLIIIVIFYTLCNLYTNVLIKDVVASLGTFNQDLNEFITIPDESKFIKALSILIIVYIMYCILQYLSSLLGSILSTKMVRKMRNDMFKKIVLLPISYVDTHPHGDIMSRVTNDVDNISTAISQSITSLISGILMILGCLAIMIWYSPALTLVSLIVLLLTLIITRLISKRMTPLFIKQQEIIGKLNSQTEETVSGCKTVIANSREQEAIKEFNEVSNIYTKVGIKAQIIGGSMGPLMNFIGNFGYFLICIFGSIFVIKGLGKSLLGAPLTISIVIMFLQTTKQFTRPINEIANLYSNLISALAASERVFELMDEKTEDLNENINNDIDIDGRVDFKNVCFSYVATKPVLTNFNLSINKGNKIALVGATGSGKTTIVNLLLRFYDINSGEILLDGKNVLSLSKKKIRDSISIVLQDPVLFNDTILNNVKYGREDATNEDVYNALRLANCMSFIDRLPDGINTFLSEGATNISQGQRQLLTIARAILANPEILILDEATSSVDTRTEKNIQSAMVNLMRGRTSIIIAHRLSTIQDADLIVVLDNGHVVEKGNHDELIALGGVYNKLYQTQFSGLDT